MYLLDPPQFLMEEKCPYFTSEFPQEILVFLDCQKRGVGQVQFFTFRTLLQKKQKFPYGIACRYKSPVLPDPGLLF